MSWAAWTALWPQGRAIGILVQARRADVARARRVIQQLVEAWEAVGAEEETSGVGVEAGSIEGACGKGWISSCRAESTMMVLMISSVETPITYSFYNLY